ncbi:MAG TPA: glycosyltransferase family 39 protein [Holophagaceae bacterium]
MKHPWTPPPMAWGAVLALVSLKLLVHLAASGSYGYFRDELYFLDCARHLQWGYVDDAPGIVWLFKGALAMGGSLRVIRILAALGGAATVFMASLIARELGGRGFAQALAALGVLAAPIFLAMDGILCVGAWEPLFWMGCAFLLLRIARTGNARLWLWFGGVAGLGLLLKYTMGLVLVCFLASMLLTPLRREFRKPLFWAGAALALLLFLPALMWQVQHHFPLLTDMENIRREGKNVVLGPFEFVKQQVELLDPLLLPLWLAGLVGLFRRREARVLGWFYLLLLGAMILLHGKNYYLAAVYPLLFGAGGVVLEQALDRWTWSRDRTWPRAVLMSGVGATFLLLVPALVPLLPPQRLLAYQIRLHLKVERAEVNHAGPLDQVLGDQFGWPELAQEVARIYASLPPEERARTGIYAGNYGEAGAINQFGPALGLPTAICAHQANSFWGLPSTEPVNLICLGCSREGLAGHFDSVTEVGMHQSPWGMAEENHPIYLGRQLRTPLHAIWPRITHWN